MPVLVLFAAALLAQAEPVATQAVPPPVSAVPPPSCKKPNLVKRLGITEEDVANTGEAAQAYVDCMKPYIQEKGQKANALMVQAKAEAEANNTAVAEINTFIAAYKEWAAEVRKTAKQ